MSNIMYWKQRYIDKDGTNVYADVKMQCFYDKHGATRWIVGCMDRWSYDYHHLFLGLPNACDEEANPPYSPQAHETMDCTTQEFPTETRTTAQQPTPSSAFAPPPPPEQVQIPFVEFETFETLTATSCTASSRFSSEQCASSPPFSSSSSSPLDAEPPTDVLIERLMQPPTAQTSPLADGMSPLFSEWMDFPLRVEYGSSEESPIMKENYYYQGRT